MTEGERSLARKEAPLSNVDTTDGADPGGMVALVAVCGLPGVGKTTVAERIAGHVNGDVLRTDVVRKELFDEPEYSKAETEAVYAELIRRARRRVDAGSTVVLDATFANARFRTDVRETGARVADAFALVEVVCDESVVERRIKRRDGISDADFEIHLHFKELFDRIERDHVVVDNSGDEAATFAQIDAAFGGWTTVLGESTAGFDDSAAHDSGDPRVEAVDTDRDPDGMSVVSEHSVD